MEIFYNKIYLSITEFTNQTVLIHCFLDHFELMCTYSGISLISVHFHHDVISEVDVCYDIKFRDDVTIEMRYD